MLKLITSLTRAQKGWVMLAVDLLMIPVALCFMFVLEDSLTSVPEGFGGIAWLIPYMAVAGTLVQRQLGLPMIKLKAYEMQAAWWTIQFAFATALVGFVLSGFGSSSLKLDDWLSFAVILAAISAAWRVVGYRVVDAIYRKSKPRTRVLIYGAGTTGTQLALALKAHETIDPVAFVDDNTTLQGLNMHGFAVYNPVEIQKIVKDRQIDRVLLAMPSLSPPKLAEIATRLEALGLDIQSLPSFAQLVGEEAPLVDKLAPLPSHVFLGRETNDILESKAADNYTDRSILVSGAGGSIGSELCRQILACRPRKLVAFEMCELALYTLDQEIKPVAERLGVEFVPVLGSVNDQIRVSRILAAHNVQVVLHAAAYKHVPLVEANPLAGLNNNVVGTHVLASEAANFGVERFILVSSDKAVRPASVMGASKRLAELVVQELATRWPNTIFSMVRFGNVLGSSGSVLPLFREQVSRGGPVTVTDPRVKRFFMTIGEAVQLVLTAGADANGGEVFVLDMGAPVPVMQLARQVIEAAGYSVQDEENPNGDIKIEITGLRPGEKLEEELSESGDLVGTRNRKIFLVEENVLSEIEIASMLRSLRQAVSENDIQSAFDVIERWVKGYRATNALEKMS